MSTPAVARPNPPKPDRSPAHKRARGGRGQPKPTSASGSGTGSSKKRSRHLAAQASQRPAQPIQEAHGNRKERTQARILDAALKLFARRGYDRSSVSAIATRAGVSHSAVFWHFGSKQNLFQEACAHMLRPFVDQLAKSLQQQDPRSRLFELFAVYEHFVFENRQAIETMVRWVLESRTLRTSLERPLLSLHSAFARDVRETLEHVLDRPQQAAPLAAGLVSLLDGNLLLSLIDSAPASQQQRRAGLRALTQLALDQGGISSGKTVARGKPQE